ncbi:MAG: septum formation initiator family protein [Treponema sp.]|nr:septum formation initiator family protein [Treponema sp.]
MKRAVKNFFYKVLVCVLAALVPLILIVYGFQTKRYSELSREVKKLEKTQEELIEQNKKLVGDISLLSSTDVIEKKAVEELGMHKAETEDIVRVEMNGEKK